MFKSAPHIDNVTYAIRNVVAAGIRLEKAGKKILYCNIGDPLKFDFKTPPHMVAAVEKAMADGFNGYAPSAGIASARDAVATHARELGMPKVTADNVFITSGASEAIDLVMTATLEEGDEVLLPSPGYPLYNAIAARLQAKVASYYPDESKGWQIDPEEVASHITPRTRLLVLCNPNNPTGAVQPVKVVQGLLDVARRHKLLVISDEIYDELYYDGKHSYTGTLANDIPIVMVGGLSKGYLACGWRVGWPVFVNPETTKEVEAAVRRLADARLCAPGPVQYAVAPALTGSKAHIVEMMAKLRSRRDLAVSALNKVPGISVVEPKAAFYAMPRIDLPGMVDDEKFIMDLVEDVGVLFVHGSGFGEKAGTYHFRVVYLPNEEILTAAFNGLNAFVRKRYS